MCRGSNLFFQMPAMLPVTQSLFLLHCWQVLQKTFLRSRRSEIYQYFTRSRPLMNLLVILNNLLILSKLIPVADKEMISH